VWKFQKKRFFPATIFTRVMAHCLFSVIKHLVHCHADFFQTCTDDLACYLDGCSESILAFIHFYYSYDSFF
jgi:hypothetical protein